MHTIHTLCCALLCCLFHAVVLPAQSNLAFYTGNEVGDTVVTYGDDNRYTARFYAFVDESSCFTCMQTLSNIAGKLAERQDIQIVLFMRTRNESSIERFRREYDWQLPVVHDVATAYRRLYNIVQYPVCLLTDVGGVIRYIDIPGKSTFSIEALDEALEQIAGEQKRGDGSLRRISSHPLRYRDGEVPGGWSGRSGMYIASRDDFLFWNADLNEFYVLDRRGRVVKHVDMSRFEMYNITLPVPVKGRIGPERIPFVSVNHHIPPPVTVYEVDLESERLRQLFDSPLPDSAHYPCEKVLQLNDTTFLLGHRYSNSAAVALYPDLFTSRIMNSSGRVIGTRGRYEDYVRTLPVQKFFAQAFCLDEAGNIFEHSTLGDTIRLYDRSGTLLRSIACSYDSTYWNYGWRGSFARLWDGAPVEEYKKLADSLTLVAGIDGLLYDTEKRQIYVVYRRKLVSPAGLAADRYYLHHPEQEGFVKSGQRDLALPGDAKPVHISSGILYCMETVDGVMSLTTYTVPHDL